MSKLKPCQTADVEDAIGYMKQMRLLCDTDDGFVPQVYDLAIDALRRAQPANEPLTLAELREMRGEPVWVETPGQRKFGRWGIVCGADDDEYGKTLYLHGDYTCRNYGKTWLAYRRKPEMFIGVDLASGHDFTAYGRPPERSENDA